jgi:two-component system, LytTR family, response regulator
MDNTLLIRAIIVDDEKRGISTLRQLIEKYIDGVKVVAECMKPAEAVELIENMRPEIVFLDIDMPGMNGFEMLDRLDWKNFSLVFTTAHQEYGLRALKNNAIDYLLKPINHRELSSTIDRIRKKLAENKVVVSFNYGELLHSLNPGKIRLLIHSTSGLEYVDPDEIICLESQSNYTKIILANAKEVITRKTLKEFESQLCRTELDFMRVHNSFIINLSKVLRYLKGQEEIILADEIRVPLSKARRDSFFNWLAI